MRILIKDCDGGDECSGLVRVSRGHFSEEVTFEKRSEERRDKPCKYRARMVQAEGQAQLRISAQGQGLPRWLSGKECTCPCRRCSFNPWVGKIPWRRARQPTPVFLPGESHGQRSLVGYSP